MTGMEAAIAYGILKVAGNKLVSLLTSEFAAITGVKKDLVELEGIHGEIAGLLTTVRDLSIQNDPIFGWVIKLKDVAYDVDDLLYEVHLEAEKHKIANDSRKHAIADSLSVKPRSFMYRCKVARKIKEIKMTLAAIAKQRNDMNAIGHNIPQSRPILSRNRVNVELSLLTNVEESQIPTRDQEKVSIISKLLESDEGEYDWIVSIVGLGGTGKTTLAKHICHDNKIKEHFIDKIYWVHVSQVFDVKKLIGKMFEAITKQKSDLHAPQHMVDEISRKLTREKFLVVLDDAWHQDKEDWKEFLVNLRSRTTGSKLLVTTRDQKVAEAVKSEHIFNLAYLSEIESWSLFLNNSGWKEEDLGSEFIQFGKEIVNKCGGVPLAIKTLGSILSEKREISTWRAISQSDLWNEENIEGRVFASLTLSYIHLKDHLKECFIFCSIFPKGYRIYKNNLIEQWIANGFIKEMKDEQPDVIGSEYFDLLVKVGFLQDPCESWPGTGVAYKMHDLIHDLTRYILQSEVATSPLKNMTKGCRQKCRYLSLTSCDKKDEMVFFDKVRALCVLEANPSLDKLVKKSRYICSVVLECAVGTPFPLFILKLNYLGYLEIHDVFCTKLPEGISGCWNLQSLLFIYCTGFKALPESIGKLKKLRTLELTWTELESLPHSIGDCRDLQLLQIRMCKLREMPNTIGKLKKLRTLVLSCIDLESLPQSIGDCRDLQSLQIWSCQNFVEIPNTIGKNGNLRVLQIVDCNNLQQLPLEVIGKFSSIQTINLAGCASLRDLPSTFCSHTLHTLNLSRTGLTKLPECVTLIGNLQCMNLEGCHDLEELPRGIGNLKRLEFLNLKSCRSLHWMPSGFAQLTRLKRLDLYVVGHAGDDARITDLENLNMISGNLELRNLPHLMDSSDAEKACLKKKKNIRNLKLSWCECATEEEFVSNLGVLDALEPPSKIEMLCIGGYRGSHLPCWMSTQSDSSCLEGVVLNQTSQSPFLCMIELTLCEIPNLKHMRGILVLPSLKTLLLRDMPNFEELWTTTSGLGIREEEEVGEQYCFPVLSHLDIYRCPKLIVEPYFPPSLESLSLESCNSQLPPFAATPHLARLESLELSWCTDLKELPVSMRGLTSLKTLDISHCSALVVLPEWLGELRSLRTISISECGNLKQLPYAIQHLTSLLDLRLIRCNALTELPEGIGKLSALQRLYINYCSALQSLPSSIQRLTSLERLHVIGCPELSRRYKKEVGDDWQIVSHIPDVYIC